MANVPKVFLDEKQIAAQAAAAPQTRQALRDKAERMAPAAKRAALDAGAVEVARSIRVESGTRPGTKSPTGLRRPFARVIADDPQGYERGNVGVPKVAFLRKAMRA